MRIRGIPVVPIPVLPSNADEPKVLISYTMSLMRLALFVGFGRGVNGWFSSSHRHSSGQSAIICITTHRMTLIIIQFASRFGSLAYITGRDYNGKIYCVETHTVRWEMHYVRTRAGNGSSGHGSWVKWVNKCEWVAWAPRQYCKTLDLWLGEVQTCRKLKGYFTHITVISNPS